jgi:hypothetical protein
MAKREKKRGRGDNSRTPVFEAHVSFPGVDTVVGTLVAHNKTGVTFEYTRYGSSYQQFFPARQIIACIGSATSKESMLWFRTNAKNLWSTGKRNRPIILSTAPEEFGEHLLMAQSPDFPVVLMNQGCVEFTQKTTGGGRGRKKRPKGEGAVKSSANGSGKKNKRARKGGDWTD